MIFFNLTEIKEVPVFPILEKVNSQIQMLQLNFPKYEKILKRKIFYLKEIYKFCYIHFSIKCIFFVLIGKISLKIKNYIFD